MQGIESIANSIDSLDITEDTSLDLPLVLSALESLDEQNANDIAEELSALAAIYNTDSTQPSLKLYRPGPTARRPSPPPTWTPSSLEPLRLILSASLEDEVPIHLLLSIPYPDYPTSEPPLIQLQDRYLGKYQVTDELFGQVLRTFMHDAEAGTASGVEWSGAVCLFEGIQLVKEMCADWIKHQEEQKQRGEERRQEAARLQTDPNGVGTDDENEDRRDEAEREVPSSAAAKGRRRTFPDDDLPCPEIYSTEGLIDRKSLFVAHAARVHSIREVETVMSTLLSNNKIARATHNISAYQFVTSDGIRHSDNDDDGEKAAGSSLASLLEKIDVQNILVVVSRWYGGIHLGPDRFKDINQAARDAITEGGFLPSATDKAKSKAAGKNGRQNRK